MTINLPSINGSKTYLSLIAYIAYGIALRHGYIQAMPDVELLLKGAIGASFVHKVSKIGDPSVPPANK